MAANQNSSDGIAEDLIRAFVQVGCAELHAKTLLEKANAELENGIIDIYDENEVRKQTEKMGYLTSEIEGLANLRRRIMLQLYEMYHGDKSWWCMVKHLGTGAYTMFEAYQASDNDPLLLDMALSYNKRFISAMSQFLGLEITECAACFADALKGAT